MGNLGDIMVSVGDPDFSRGRAKETPKPKTLSLKHVDAYHRRCRRTV